MSIKGSVITPVLAAQKGPRFDPQTFLSTSDFGRTIANFSKNQPIFVQGDSSDAVFYIHEGKVRIIVVSKTGKEATIAVLDEGDFFGEGCLAGQPLRICSATAMTDCAVMRIDKKSMMTAIHRETCVFRYVRGIFADAKYPIRSGFG